MAGNSMFLVPSRGGLKSDPSGSDYLLMRASQPPKPVGWAPPTTFVDRRVLSTRHRVSRRLARPLAAGSTNVTQPVAAGPLHRQHPVVPTAARTRRRSTAKSRSKTTKNPRRPPSRLFFATFAPSRFLWLRRRPYPTNRPPAAGLHGGASDRTPGAGFTRPLV